ncbi:alpha/beta hydrolase [Urechidicola croceus]|uniref:AB hydrolase-1 domain-containing protein n=1 Tax=Urechidicola croceus TaxID=1850246 RepID=A0A1D8P3V6_9FLAO|nr:alpha/beta fold hydrolase [Urechidicola croceus]AOW19248.1 hypothetical protein LPB138_00460 [Urechidicola croceus]
MRFFKKVLKIVSYTIIAIFIILLVLINVFFKPKTDKDLVDDFAKLNKELYITHKEFRGFPFRLISNNKKNDTSLVNIVFVHGSPGTLMDFKKYLIDDDLNQRANFFVYDRVGYGIETIGQIQHIQFEVDMLNEIVKDFDLSKTILVGYSYGGPIALASKKEYKKVVLLAPAVYSEVEPMFWFLNFYKWKLTRWVIPDMLKTASKEKLQHKNDLKFFENSWGDNPSSIYVIHGNNDKIVPYENSEFIQEQFSSDKFELITLNEAGHDLIWSRYKEIKKELIKVIEE